MITKYKEIINLDYAGNYPKNLKIMKQYTDVCYLSHNLHSNHILGWIWKHIYKKSEKIYLKIFWKYPNIEFISSSGWNANKKCILNTIPYYPENRNIILISCIEHSSIYKTCFDILTKRNYNVLKIQVDENGIIDIKYLKKFIKKNEQYIKLISVMCVNNETGIIQPINEIWELIKNKNIIFHSDITQGIIYFINNIMVSHDIPHFISFSWYKIGGTHMGVILRKNKTIYEFEDYNGSYDIPWIY